MKRERVYDSGCPNTTSHDAMLDVAFSLAAGLGAIQQLFSVEANPIHGRVANPIHSSSLPFCVRFKAPVTVPAACTVDGIRGRML